MWLYFPGASALDCRQRYAGTMIMNSGKHAKTTRMMPDSTLPPRARGKPRRCETAKSLLPLLKGITEDDDDEEDSKAADEAEITGQAAPDKLRAELQKRKKEAEQ